MSEKKQWLSRRQFLKQCLQLSAGCAVAQATFGQNLNKFMHNLPERQLSFYNLRTGEKLKTTYWADGNYIQSHLADINRLLRDFRQNETITIDPTLIDQLFAIQRIMETKGTIQVISGYRTPQTNNMLIQQKRGAVKNSYHTLGRAIDLNITGVKLEHLQKAAIIMKAGGVGYYPSSQFVHLDTGPVRKW